MLRYDGCNNTLMDRLNQPQLLALVSGKPHRIHCHTLAQVASGTASNGRQTGKQRKTDKVCVHSKLSFARDISKALWVLLTAPT